MKTNLWKRISAVGIAAGMLFTGMPIVVHSEAMIEDDEFYIVTENDTEAAMAPETGSDFYNDNLITDEDDLYIGHESEIEAFSDETELELHAAADDIVIDSGNFPDPFFLSIISQEQYDRNGDGILSADEIASVTTINVFAEETSSLEGIEYFTNLTGLFCPYCSLTSLDVSKNTALQDLNCTGNLLKSLDVSKCTDLQILSCENNRLTSLNLGRNTALRSLYCFGNQLTGLDVSGCTALQELDCYSNGLTKLKLGKHTAMEHLSCTGNQMATLDISGCPKLIYLVQNGECITTTEGQIEYKWYDWFPSEYGYCYMDYDAFVTLILTGAEAPHDPVIVVSLGDSYSSGEGIEPFYGQDLPISVKVDDRDWLAHRSQNSWPGMLKIPGIDGTMKNYKYDPNLTTESLKKQDCIWYFRAVSGAETKHFSKAKQKKTVRQTERYFKKEEKYLPLQLDVFNEIDNRGLGTVDYVTLSVGGNDVGFADIITTCAMKSTYLGSNALEEQLNGLWANIETTENNIRDVYYEIHERTSQETTIIVAGYPKLLDPNGKGAAISWKEANLVNSSVTLFNSRIRNIVQSCHSDMNIYFVDIEQKFGTTHQAYSNENWLNGIILGARDQDLDHLSPASSYSLHPNYYGAVAYATEVNAKIKEIASSDS